MNVFEFRVRGDDEWLTFVAEVRTLRQARAVLHSMLDSDLSEVRHLRHHAGSTRWPTPAVNDQQPPPDMSIRRPDSVLVSVHKGD